MLTEKKLESYFDKSKEESNRIYPEEVRDRHVKSKGKLLQFLDAPASPVTKFVLLSLWVGFTFLVYAKVM